MRTASWLAAVAFIGAALAAPGALFAQAPQPDAPPAEALPAPAEALPAAESAKPPADSREEQLKKRASEHFERGVTLFRDGAYRAALIEFERAYATVPDYRLLYNQAQMRMLLQDYLGATRDYERYLVEGGERVPEERRLLVEQELGILRNRVARVAIRANRDQAKVYIDDGLVGETPIAATLPLNVGRHRIYAEASDGASAARVVDLAAGELLEVTLELRAPKVKTVVMRETVPAPVQGSNYTAWALSTTIAAGALTAAALGVGFSARRAEHDLEREVREIPASKQQIDTTRDKARRLSISTDVLGGLAAASAVTAVVLWALSGRDEQDDRSAAQVSAQIGVGTVALAGRF